MDATPPAFSAGRCHEVQPNFQALSGVSPAATANTLNAATNAARGAGSRRPMILMISRRRRAVTVRTSARPSAVSSELDLASACCRSLATDQALFGKPITEWVTVEAWMPSASARLPTFRLSPDASITNARYCTKVIVLSITARDTRRHTYERPRRQQRGFRRILQPIRAATRTSTRCSSRHICIIANIVIHHSHGRTDAEIIRSPRPRVLPRSARTKASAGGPGVCNTTTITAEYDRYHAAPVGHVTEPHAVAIRLISGQAIAGREPGRTLGAGCGHEEPRSSEGQEDAR